MRTINRIIAVARQAGSTAQTTAGAIKYLRTHGLPQTPAEPTLRPIEARQKRIQRRLSRNGWHYNRSSSSWAGGDHGTTWTIGADPQAYCYSSIAWSSNGKWTGSNSQAEITITQRTLTVLAPDRLYIGGLLTVDAVRVAPRVLQATWVEQSRGVSVKLVSGYIVRGYHVAVDNLETALRRATRARKRTLAQAIAKRADKRQRKLEAAQYRTIWVTEADSIAAGNCPNGTKNGKNRLTKLINADGDIGAVRADFLLYKLADQKTYVLRAINAAKNRQEITNAA